jgi:hypothetical protein
MTPKSLDKALKLAKSSVMRLAIEEIVVEMERYNWQPCVYGVRPMRIGEREPVIDRSYKTPSPFIKITKLTKRPATHSWFGVTVKAVWIAMKIFLMLYGAWWIIFFTVKALR